MTLLHFVNCSLLSYIPHIIIFKYTGINEYTNAWMPIQAGVMYFLTQFIKLMIMATFFPESSSNFFNLPIDVLKSITDVFDVIGIYFLIIYYFMGKHEVRCLSVGIGWSFAHSFANYFPSLVMGARGVAFDYKYIRSAIQSNIDLLFYICLAILIWLYSRNDIVGLNRYFVTIGLIISIGQPIILSNSILIFLNDYTFSPSLIGRGFLTLLISGLTLYTYVKSPTCKGKYN
uniref:BOS complex subunit TMEM147 n=1 Tax=Parastrongyloides trichosuri TaxID=131310 RepID=A0A0N4ZVB7_PARTI